MADWWSNDKAADDSESWWEADKAEDQESSKPAPAIKPARESTAGAGRGDVANDPRRLDTTPVGQRGGRRSEARPYVAGTAGAQVEEPDPTRFQEQQVIRGDATAGQLLNAPRKPGTETAADLESMSRSPAAIEATNQAAIDKAKRERFLRESGEFRAQPERGIVDRALDATIAKPLDQSAAGLIVEAVGDAARGVRRAGQGLASSAWSGIQAGAEAVGADGLAAMAGEAGKFGREERARSNNTSDPNSLTQQIFESTFTSVPLVVALGGGVGLGALMAQSAANDYGESRDRGLTHSEALPRAAWMGIAEGIGERFGMPQISRLFEQATAGAGAKAFAKTLADLIWREQAGEQVTLALQNAYEATGPQGTKPNLTLEQYLQEAADTAMVTAGQSLLTGGLAAGVKRLAPRQEPEPSAIDIARSKGFLGGPQAGQAIDPLATPSAAPGAPIAAARQGVSFTPPDSEVARAGITPIVAPVGPAGAPQVDPIQAPPGPGITPPAAAVVPPQPGQRPDFQAAMAGVEQNQEAAAAAPAPDATWTGRRGDGYATEADAAGALADRQRRQPNLDWKVEPRQDGRFELRGYVRRAQETTDVQQPAAQPRGLGLAGQPQQGGAALAGEPGRGGGVQPRVELGSGPSAGAAPVGGAVAPAVDPGVVASDLKRIQDQRLKRGEVTKLEVSSDDTQPEVRAVAAAFGVPVVVLRDKNGAAGFGAVAMDKGRIYINEDAPDAPLKLAVHEIVHTLPAGIRNALVERAMLYTTKELKGKFLWKYDGYKSLDEARQNEEMVAMFAQDDAKTPEFWESLRGKLGDRDFAGLAKHILSKLNQLLTRVRGGDDRQFFTDIAAVRDLVTEALARAERGETYWNDDLEVAGDGGVDVKEISAEEAGFSEGGKRPYQNAPDSLMGYKKFGPQKSFAESKGYKHVEFVRVTWADGDSIVDAMRGLNKPHALERAWRNWKDAENIEAISREEAEAEDPGIGDEVDAQFSEEGKRDYKLGVERGERATSKVAGLSEAERVAIERDAAELGLDAAQVKALMESARDTRRRFPVRAGWAPIEVAGLSAKKDKKTKKVKVDKKGKPIVDVKWTPIPYGFNVPPGKNRAGQQHDRELARKVANNFTRLVLDIFERAKSGDRAAQTIVAHQTWYRNVAEVLRREFGSQGDLFADLLGATSPNTPVDTNWRFSIEVLQRFMRGDFDSEMKAFIEHIESGGRPSEFEGEQIRQVSGKLYGMNSTNAMIALANLWRNIEPGSAPKARNFALNLIGQSNMATIDVWAARMLRRAADMVRGQSLPRIPPPAEQGVSGNWNADVTGVGGEFGFGALVMEMVSKDLKKRGIDMPPPDLQAVAWFAEKELWTRNNWTSVQGEGGSFEEAIDSTPMTRYMAGFSVQQGEKRPDDEAVSTAQARVLAMLHGDDTIISAHMKPTYGVFMMKPEEAFDLEWIAKRGQHNPALALAEISRLAKENNQHAIFVSRVLRPDEVSSNARPGAEVFFKKGTSMEEVKSVMDVFIQQGMDGFTLSVDPRAKTGARPGREFIGVRLQYVPEFDDTATPENVDQLLAEKEARLDDIVRELRARGDVAAAAVGRYDTVVVSKDDYDAFIDRGSASQDRQAGSEAWPQRSVRERLEGAAARITSDAGQVDAGRVPDAGDSAGESFSEVGRGGDRGRRDRGRGLAPLPGAPTVEGATGPDEALVAVAEDYARSVGIDLKRQSSYVEVDEDRARRIAAAYDAMPHAPQDPRVREAYQNLIRQTRAQYDALVDAGYQFWFMDPAADPYGGNPWNAMRDLRANKRMAVFPTEAGFGSGATELNVDDNPLLEDTGIEWGFGDVDGPAKRVLANDLFRAVHDAFGHGLEGAGFRARGEENAWQAHVRLFTGSAVGAITSETRGQNSWLNYGPYGEKNQTAKVEDTVFADQKTGLMPEWTWREGVVDDGIQASEVGRQSDMFYDDFATKRTTVETDIVISSNGDRARGGNVNSAGQQIAQTKQALKNFWSWFGASEATDDRGRPMLMYHSTNSDIARFEVGRKSTNNYGFLGDVEVSRSGIFMTPNKSFSQEYLREGSGQNVMPVYASIKNPLDLRSGLSYKDERALEAAGVNARYVINVQNYWELFDNSDDGSNDFVTGLRAAGYDGAIFREASPGGESDGGVTYVAFDPAQVKSALGNRGTFGADDDRISFSESESPWYSALSRAIEKGPNQAPADQWRAFLKGLPGKGVKQDEIEWSGVEEWLKLQTGKVQRQAVLDYLNANGVKVEEVVLGGQRDAKNTRSMEDDLVNRAEQLQADGNDAHTLDMLIRGEPADRVYRQMRNDGDMLPSDFARDIQEWYSALVDSGDKSITKYGQYTLPGGTRYREVLLTLPERRPLTEHWRDMADKYGDSDPRTVAAKKAARAEAGMNAPKPYKSSHWDQPNILAHIRLNDRTDADGKRVLFVEEIQSDWGQQGKKDGFRKVRGPGQEMPEGYTLIDEAELARKEGMDIPADETGPWQFRGPSVTSRIYKDREEAIAAAWKDASGEYSSKPPAAPFVQKTDSWLGLALKRVITMAVREGYDRVAFVTGEQAADRFSLDKQVDEIHVMRDGDKFDLGFKVNGSYSNGPSERGIGAERIEELVGKEMAERILAQPQGRSYMRGDQLKLEAKGMRAFYDVIVPNAVKPLLKKLGGGGVVDVGIDIQGRPEDGSGLREQRVYEGPDRSVGEIRSAAYGSDLPSAIQGQLIDVANLMRGGSSLSDAMRAAGSISAARAIGGDMVSLPSVVSKQPGFDITTAMREAAGDGLPMFSEYGKEKDRFGRKFLPGQRQPKRPRAGDLKVGSVKSDATVNVLTRAIDDEYPIVNAARKAGSAVADAWKIAVEALPGRTADAINQAHKQLIDPLVKAMGEAAKSLKMDSAQLIDAYGIYRLAKHAPERNKTLRANGSKKANPAGMSEAEAAQWMTFFRGEPDLLRALESFDPMLKAIQDRTDSVKLAAGLITQEEIDSRSDWDWYVSLRGDPGADETGGVKGGGGWNNDIDPRARGRDSLSANPVINTVKMLENAIRLAEMARVKKATYEMAEAHPDILQAKITRVFNRPFFDEDGNFARAFPNTDKFSMDSIVYRNGDVEYKIEIGDGKVINAIKKLENRQLDPVIRGFGKLVSVLGRLFTQFSPHFPLVNFIRDLQQQIAYIAGQDIEIGGRKISSAKAAFMIMSRYPKTFAAAVSEVMGRTPTGKYTRLARELHEQGGMSGFSKMFSDEEALADFTKRVEWKAGKAVSSLAWNKFVDFVGDVSEVFEMTTRVAAYSVMRDMGMPPSKSANFTKNLMNFSKAGTSVRGFLGNFYMFLKPSIQDVYLTSKLLRTKKGAIVLGSMYAGAVALYAMLRELSGDDEEDPRLKRMDTRNASERRAYYILPYWGKDGDKPLRIPVGFGLPRIAWGLAVTTVDGALNPDFDTAAVADGAVKSLTSTLSPMQLSENNMFTNTPEFLATTFAPTLALPVIELAMNKSKAGNTITRSSQFQQLPDYAQSFSSTPKEFKDAAEWMYDSTGGKIDVSPETLQHIMRSYGGGPAGVMLNALQSGERQRQGQEITRRDVPIVQAFTGAPDRYPEKRFRDMSKEVDRLTQQIKDSEIRGTPLAAKLQAENETLLAIKADIDRIERMESKAIADIRKLYRQDYNAAARETRALEIEMRAEKQALLDAYNEMKGNLK